MGLLEIVVLVLVGLVIGAFARLALPGPDPMGLLVTALIGIAGAVLGGVVGLLFLGGRAPGFLVSVLCATAIVYVVRKARGGSLTDPGRPRRLRR